MPDHLHDAGKKEIEKIGQHIVAIDKKMHHLMERIEEIDKLSQN
ncbi:hypothetical protein NITGR_740004 [Nitrospina gracilis 3/211]|uniref:Uncharacterized protein n=1 Tax=Nitrospina gracilis (strain 3/211) TaxID=1266370 RepID=M1Z1L2_NITG3|nr:hypothetical protein NITGR_740004 [Nitrospina gracilis 3/211]